MLKGTYAVSLAAACIYFCQGLLGISGVALPLYLRNQGWTIGDVTAIMALASIPWVFKILYGILSDSFPVWGMRRRYYIIFYLLCSSLGWLLLLLFPPTKFSILSCLLIANLGFSGVDVVTDGLIVERSSKATSAFYQGLAWGSRSLGAIIGGIGGGFLAALWEPRSVFMLTLMIPLFAIPSLFIFREKNWPRTPFHSALEPLGRCFKLLKETNFQAFLGLLLISSLSSAFGMPFFFFMHEVLGFKETFLGTLASLGWLGAMMGSLIFLTALRKISIRHTIQIAIVINSLNIFSTFFIFNETSALIIVVVGGAMSCLVMLPMMSLAAVLTRHTGVESAMFAILMSAYNIGQIIFGFLGGRLYNWVGLYPLIAFTAIISLSGLIFAQLIDVKNENLSPSPLHESSD